MTKQNYNKPRGFKAVKCKICGDHDVMIDQESTSGTCFRCVTKGYSANSTFITDLSQIEFLEYRRVNK